MLFSLLYSPTGEGGLSLSGCMSEKLGAREKGPRGFRSGGAEAGAEGGSAEVTVTRGRRVPLA